MSLALKQLLYEIISSYEKYHLLPTGMHWYTISTVSSELGIKCLPVGFLHIVRVNQYNHLQLFVTFFF